LGHLFGGRYKAARVEADGAGAGDYLKMLRDDMHLNPVRTRMVKAAGGLVVCPRCLSHVTCESEVASARLVGGWSKR
jgi:hypothetical protein